MSTTKNRLGASVEEWQFFAELCEADLLPVVCNQDAKISKNSSLKGLGKVPSLYNREREVVGMRAWTDAYTTAPQIKAWMQEDDYGICIITRRYRGIDIDSENPIYAKMVADLIGPAPMRSRKGSNRVCFLVQVEGDLPKEVLKFDDGQIEFLGTGQMFVACGTHKSGERLRWEWCDVPTLTPERYREVIESLAMLAEVHTKSQPPAERGATIHKDDPVAAWLVKEGLSLGGTSRGVVVLCPWWEEHTYEDNNPDYDKAMWMYAGGGGHSEGHFSCFHAHCVGRNRSHYLEAVGYKEGDVFEDLGPDPEVEAREAEKLSAVQELNKSMAFISGPGTSRSACILKEDGENFALMDPAVVKGLLANRSVTVREKGKKPKEVPLFKFWMEHPDRRTYTKGLRFLPGEPRDANGVYNTWRGWGVEPRDVPWPRIRHHIQHVLAGGNPVVYNYIMDWLAYRVQYPAGPMRTALVLRSHKEGAGKGTLGVWLRKIFGSAMLTAHRPDDVVGRFNIGLRDCNLLLAEEAFFAGDPRHVAPLKGLITDPTLNVEQKGVSSYQVDSNVGVLMFTNELRVAKVSASDRRFAIFEVEVESRDYYTKLWADKEDEVPCPDELPGFFHELKTRDVRLWEARNFPKMEIHDDQVEKSLEGVDAFMLEVMRDGVIIEGWEEKEGSISKLDFRAMLDAWRGKNDRFGRYSDRDVKRVIELSGGRSGRDHDGPMLWRFDKLADCRDAFARNVMGLKGWKVEQ